MTVVYDGAIVLRESRTVDVSVHVFKMLPACYNTVYQLLRQYVVHRLAYELSSLLPVEGAWCCRKTA